MRKAALFEAKTNLSDLIQSALRGHALGAGRGTHDGRP